MQPRASNKERHSKTRVGENAKKQILAIDQSSAENSAAYMNLPDDLERRGLQRRDLLFVVGGASGLNKSLNSRNRAHDPASCRAVRVRWAVHDWNNLKGVLDVKDLGETRFAKNLDRCELFCNGHLNSPLQSG